MRVLGTVLVGGASTRFGSDKASARFGKSTLLDTALASLTAADLTSLAYVGGQPRNDVSPTVHHVPDESAGVAAAERSSLLGVIAALSHARHTHHDAAVILGCDVPLVSTITIQRLVASLAHADVSVAEHAGDHWSIMCARTDCLEHLRAAFIAGERAIHRATADLRLVRVPCTGAECTNVNDVATLRTVADAQPSNM